jgi:hypothetical protein
MPVLPYFKKYRAVVQDKGVGLVVRKGRGAEGRADDLV